MKTLDKYQSTLKFCITGSTAEAIASIHVYFSDFGVGLVAVATMDDDAQTYAVRISNSKGITDHVVNVIGDAVKIVETVEIIKY